MLSRDWCCNEAGAQTIAKVVHLEQVWRERPGRDVPGPQQEQVTVSRWTDPSAARRDLTIVGERDHHLLSIALRPTEIVFSSDGQARHSGRVRNGALQITRPGQAVRAEFFAPSDSLHLHIPCRVLSECYRAMHEHDYAKPIALIDPVFAEDGAIEQLGRQLISSDQLAGPHGRLYADGLILAILARLLNAHANCGQAPTSANARGLSKWRLKRARDYIEANLGETLHLSDIAASTGLSRMLWIGVQL